MGRVLTLIRVVGRPDSSGSVSRSVGRVETSLFLAVDNPFVGVTVGADQSRRHEKSREDSLEISQRVID